MKSIYIRYELNKDAQELLKAIKTNPIVNNVDIEHIVKHLVSMGLVFLSYGHIRLTVTGFKIITKLTKEIVECQEQIL